MKRGRYCFDAGVLSLYYAGDKRVKPYFDDVFAGKSLGFASEVNLAEFYYKAGQKLGLEAAEAWYLQTRRSEIEVTPPDEDITRSTARLKVKHYTRLSLADCFAIATAEASHSVLLTTDTRIDDVGEVRTQLFPL